MPTEPSHKPPSQANPQPAEPSATKPAGQGSGTPPNPASGSSRKAGAKSTTAPGGRLDAEAIVGAMQGLPEWTQSGEALQRTLRFADFAAAMGFVDRIAEIAEQQGHHPDILIRYNKVTLTLSTHDAGGITAKDFTLAEAIERIVPR